MSKHTIRIPDEHRQALETAAHERSSPGHRVTWQDLLREAIARHVALLQRRKRRRSKDE